MEISNLDVDDFVHLVATYNELAERTQNDVTSEVEARGYSPEQLQVARKMISEKFDPITSCGLRFTKPFKHLKFEPIGYVLTLFENYERGCLPFPGSVSEQPAQIMEIFTVLKQLKHESESRLRASVKSNGRYQHQNKPRVS